MQSPLNYTENYASPQSVFTAILEKVTPLYEKYVPKAIKNRRNVALQKQSDPVVIAAVLWAMMEGHQKQMDMYRAIRSSLFPDRFPERSRFCRLCQNLSTAIKLIRHFFIGQLTEGTELVIIDSLPCPLCKPIRNKRATLLQPTADIGYNATKRMHYYGLKLSFLVTETGFPVNYVVSAASIHDIRLVVTLAQATPFPYILGDKGYLSRGLKEDQALKGIVLTTPLRKNMVGADKLDDRLLSRRRKKVETVFSSLENLGIQAFQSRTMPAFEFRLEAILLVYAFLLEQAQKRHGNTLRYSLGRF